MMKRDVETNDPEALPHVRDTIMKTVHEKEEEVTEAVKGKKKKGKKLMKQPKLTVKEVIKAMPNEGKLRINDLKQYKVY